MVSFNCASFNPNLVESELFGHERGAFTGAMTTRRGRFEDADGGTLFLDEIGETSPEFQAKLLRVLQEGKFERVGGNKEIRVDVRLLASTNRDLETQVKSGTFREDLYYRLRVIPLHIPPLRERREDIAHLASHFLNTYNERYRCAIESISDAGLEYLVAQEWKGNVRELQHTIERAVVLARGDSLEPADFAYDVKPGEAPLEDRTLQAFVDRKSREYLLEVLDRENWRKQRVAKILGIDRVTLYRMLKKYSIEKGIELET